MNIDFLHILIESKSTVYEETQKYKNNGFSLDVIIDNSTCYRAILNWSNCMGELLIEKNDFSPYRYVSFKIVSIDSKNENILYCWYDSEGDSLEVVKQKIIEGIKIGDNYNPVV